jgi:hypothetical protein
MKGLAAEIDVLVFVNLGDRSANFSVLIVADLAVFERVRLHVRSIDEFCFQGLSFALMLATARFAASGSWV